jgi:hypothetical protein
MPQGISPHEEAYDEDIDHTHCRGSPLDGYFLGSSPRDYGIIFLKQHAKVANGRKLSILYQHVRKRRTELQIRKHGGLRKGRKATEPELFAEPQQEHHRREVKIPSAPSNDLLMPRTD